MAVTLRGGGGGDGYEVSMASKEWMQPARGLDSRKMRNY
jgi:hypothetical protein